LETLQCDNNDQKVGINMIKTACKMPARTILNNAGEEAAVIVGTLFGQEDQKKGFNA